MLVANVSRALSERYSSRRSPHSDRGCLPSLISIRRRRRVFSASEIRVVNSGRRGRSRSALASISSAGRYLRIFITHLHITCRAIMTHSPSERRRSIGAPLADECQLGRARFTSGVEIERNGASQASGDGMGWVGMGWDGMGWDGIGWDGMRWGGIGWDGMGWDGVGWDGIGWDGMGWDGMGWDGMGWDGMGWDGMGWDGMGWDGMGWDGMGWDGMGWDGMGWDGMGWDGMGWDGMGWDGMGWDGMGWDGMGWDRVGWDGMG